MAPYPRSGRKGSQEAFDSESCPGATHTHAHQVLLFFRTASVKDSSFVEKMKKTVSFLCVCARPQGVEALVDGGGRPAPARGGRAGQARTFSSLQSTEAVLRGPESFRCLLDVYFLNQPHCETSFSLRLRGSPLSSCPVQARARAGKNLTQLWPVPSHGFLWF